MLNRQKSILLMIEQADRPVSRLELTKWMFLLARETPSSGGPFFYQFLPYRKGPFSFCLYREVSSLVRDGYLAETNLASQDAWGIVEDVERPTGTLPPAVRRDVKDVVGRFKGKTTTELLDYVYSHYPWYTVNSARERLQARPLAELGVYTVGYEGWLVDGFLDLLLRVGIRRVVDVRSNPVARRYGFHKSSLGRLCDKVGIEYAHFPQLGIPRGLRRDLNCRDDYEELFAHYESNILPREKELIEKVAQLMMEKPSALLCMERDPSRCHRARLAKFIAEKTGLSMRHLGVRNETGV